MWIYNRMETKPLEKVDLHRFHNVARTRPIFQGARAMVAKQRPFPGVSGSSYEIGEV